MFKPDGEAGVRGLRSRYRTDDLFHEVEEVKAFPTANDTKLEKRDALPVVKR
jgi:hypothetical protein